MNATAAPGELTVSGFDAGSVVCPQCGGRDMMTYVLEGSHQACSDGDWSEDSYADDEFILKVWCHDCKHVLLDRQQEVWDALEEILVRRPERERQGAELEQWAEANGINFEDVADESIHDYFGEMAASVNNAGRGAQLECLLEIYESPAAVKVFLGERVRIEEGRG